MTEDRRLTAERRGRLNGLGIDDLWSLCKDALHDLDLADVETAEFTIRAQAAERACEDLRTKLQQKDETIRGMEEAFITGNDELEQAQARIEELEQELADLNAYNAPAEVLNLRDQLKSAALEIAERSREVIDGNETIHCLRESLAEVQAELADWKESARIAAEEPCKDEKHCACVPLLRAELADLRAELERLREEKNQSLKLKL